MNGILNCFVILGKPYKHKLKIFISYYFQQFVELYAL